MFACGFLFILLETHHMALEYSDFSIILKILSSYLFILFFFVLVIFSSIVSFLLLYSSLLELLLDTWGPSPPLLCGSPTHFTISHPALHVPKPERFLQILLFTHSPVFSSAESNLIFFFKFSVTVSIKFYLILLQIEILK